MSFDYDLHTHHELILDKNKYKKRGLSGLVNLGNRCFMNSILQCLSNTLKLTDYFLSGAYKKDDQLNKKRKEYYIVLSYLNFIINAWDTNQVLKPKSFIENISKFVPKYFKLDQQDSHECLMNVLELLHIALSYEIEINVQGKPINENDHMISESIKQWSKFYEKGYSVIVETFNGMIYNKISCNGCSIKENVFEPFNCLSLNINSDTCVSLKDCFTEHFSKCETIDSWKCERCNNSGCSKSTKLWSLPNYLIIHLKRFTNSGNKIQKDIDFPMDDLDLTEYISESRGDPNNYIYSLYAVNYHSGSADNGHYWSICKNLDNNWYLYNDCDVSQVNNVMTMKKNAYILFYYRKFIKSK